MLERVVGLEHGEMQEVAPFAVATAVRVNEWAIRNECNNEDLVTRTTISGVAVTSTRTACQADQHNPTRACS